MEMQESGHISSPESMISAIRRFGVIPFFKGAIPGYSIEELTDPDYWFYTSDELGPWDWKIDAVREGDIAYGKFMGGKAAFATAEYFRHFMNYRRSLPKYRVALGERYKDNTRSGKIMKVLSPAALKFIRDNGSADTKEMREAASKAVTPALLRSLGSAYKAQLVPTVKKNIGESILQFLEMGTWVVVGDYRRVYSGPDLHYSGWQRSSITTPDNLFNMEKADCSGPFWADRFRDDKAVDDTPACTAEESRKILINHILEFFPGYEKEIEKLI